MKLKTLFLPLVISALYLASHLFNLVSLPVFADEAIYIRWAQLILDDWQQYLFFPLNDGKTPLFIWLLTPFQLIFTDQLWAGRVVSVLVGLAQVFATGYVITLLGGKPKAAVMGMVLTSILPFWYFYQRMALMDGLLTLWLTLMIIGLVKLNNSIMSSKKWTTPQSMIWAALTGLFFGLGLWTKLPALLFLPTMAAFGFWQPKLSFTKRQSLWIHIALSALVGMGIFGLLKLTPAFGQLFSRGNDFLYPWKQVVLEGVWTTTIRNWPTYINYFVSYLTVPVMLLVVFGLFTKPHQRTNHILFWSALGFVLPIALLGKVVYPRYFLPVAIYFTVIAVLTFQDLIETWVTKQKHLIKKVLASLIMVAFLANMIAVSGVFMAFSWFKPDTLPLVPADRIQYLTEWSSGHGIVETVTLIQANSQNQSLAVATEGYFGTLPDALLLYFHGQNVNNLYIEGIGQPVVAIPGTFVSRAQSFDQVWLVVNSHRLNIEIAPEQKIAEYCRPYQAPCLQVWNITDLVKTE